MFVVKSKSKDAQSPHYSNQHVMVLIEEIELDRYLTKKNFIMSYKEALKLFRELMSRGLDSKGNDNFEYVSIVKVSSYEPYPEYEVVNYKEFK